MHLGFAAPALPILYLLVCEHGAAGVAPVDGRLFLICEPFFVKERKKPLRPTVIILPAGDDLPVPIVGEAHRTLLAFHVLDIRIRPCGGMHFILDRRVLCGHTEGVESHRVQDVVPIHLSKARDNVADRIVADMPHMQFSRRIGKHLKHVILRFFIIPFRPEGMTFLPYLLPLRLDLLRAISLHSALAPPKMQR